MKKLFAACSILGILGVAGPALAELRTESILVNQNAATPSGTNIRVGLANDGDSIETLSCVELQARNEPSAGWHTVKTWERPMTVKPHRRLALDFLPSADGILDRTLAQPLYDLRVTVTKTNGESITSASQSFEAAER